MNSLQAYKVPVPVQSFGQKIFGNLGHNYFVQTAILVMCDKRPAQRSYWYKSVIWFLQQWHNGLRDSKQNKSLQKGSFHLKLRTKLFFYRTGIILKSSISNETVPLNFAKKLVNC